MKILHHPTVDSQVWAEAVEWLMIHGSREVQELLLKASANATENCFPDMKATRYTQEGSPCYETQALADKLGIPEHEVKRILQEKERLHGIRHSVEDDEAYKVQ